MKRDAASTIFRTVVFAGAMLGVPACGGSKKPVAATPKPADPAMMQGNDKKPDSPTADDANKKPDATQGADPCAGGERPRGTDDDGGGGTGRGFVLS